QAGAGAPAQAAAPAPAAVAPAVAAPAVAAESVQKVSSEDKARQKACNRAATEQSLRGAKRKAFIGECMSG
ncbi:MAG: PsiF repeat-containing protein, partial [Rhodocyclaceae bacterium]